MVINRVGPLSAARIAALLYALIGLLAGAAFSVASVAGAFANGDGGAIAGMLFGIGAIIVLPIAYGVMGFIGTLLMSAVYNVLASLIGGIELDVR